MSMIRIGAVTWRVSAGGGVTRREGPGAWEPVPPSQLRTLSLDSDEWQWLRDHGVKRPSPSGPSGRSVVERATVQVLLRLSPRVRDILRDQADEQGIPVSGLVSELVERTWGRLYETADT